MPILISKSWSNITPESAEDGEIADSCMLWDNVECSFRELVEYMREHREPSCSPADGSTYEWYSTGYSVDDYSTGEESQTSIHYSRLNPANKAKYWRKAAIAAGIIR